MGRKAPAVSIGGRWEEHPVPGSEKMELQDYRQLGAEERDAGQDYPESNSEAPVIRLRTGSPDSTSRTGAGGEGKAARKRPREVFGVWERGTGLRHITSQAVRVRTAVGDPGVSALCDAPY
ncbi:MAG: hypothetical protein QGG54_03960, partial [Gammaproteobacteria bacterium]|nr:hypothetical protein [Gammaproteobacteria bacterium]